MMRRALLVFSLAGVISTLLLPCLLVRATVALPVQKSRPNFTGRWELDKTRSEFGSSPPDESAQEVIDHQEPRLTIAQVWRNAEGEHTLVWELTTDGAQSVTRNQETEIASRTVWDDTLLVTEWRMKRGSQLSEGRSVRALAEDRKTMTVRVQQKSAAGETNQQLVFVETSR